MPAMPRPYGKAARIAYGIIGKPSVFINKRTKRKDSYNKRLIYEETFRVR